MLTRLPSLPLVHNTLYGDRVILSAPARLA
jgi:hypothetical protein